MSTMVLSDARKREIGQHFVLGFHGQKVSKDIKVLISDYFVGGVILMKRNVKDATQLGAMIRELQGIAKEAGHEQPLLIGTDQECGLVSAMTVSGCATQFPGAMALAATNSLSITEQVYEATGKELKALGVHWAYSPVADVNSEWRNPVIGVRSFGDDPVKVGQFAQAAAKGLTRVGVAPCAKHFPGHGDTQVDSHVGLPIISKTKQQLHETELVPFKNLFESKADSEPIASIMTGHMALPLITGTNEPCSLSRKITKELLRDELGYQGLVVTDCLEMDAIADPEQGGCGIPEGAVRALAANADIVMICHTFEQQVKAIEKTWEAVETGRLNLEELTESGKRVKTMKHKFSTETAAGENWETLKEAHETLGRKAYEETVAVITKGPLPLSTGGKVLFCTPEMVSLNKAVDDAEGVLRGKGGQVRNTAGASFSFLAECIGKRASCNHIVYTTKETQPDLDLAGITAVVFVLRNADRAEWQISFLHQVVKQAKGIPVALLASCTPYDLVGVKGIDHCGYLACFEYTPPSFNAVTQVLFGEKEAKGKVPVDIDPKK